MNFLLCCDCFHQLNSTQYRRTTGCCPLLRQYYMHIDAATGSTEESSLASHSDGTGNVANTAGPEYELVLDDLQAKRGALSRAAEFLRVILLSDVVDLQALC